MSTFTHEGTEALQQLADEIQREREEKGHTAFDAIPESDGDSSREDGEGTEASPRSEGDTVPDLVGGGQPRVAGL